uniref:spondin-1 isoform X2 n=1 Tax=Myxine glutinosa TaxID=7769 RepID=UPI00358F2622
MFLTFSLFLFCVSSAAQHGDQKEMEEVRSGETIGRQTESAKEVLGSEERGAMMRKQMEGEEERKAMMMKEVERLEERGVVMEKEMGGSEGEGKAMMVKEVEERRELEEARVSRHGGCAQLVRARSVLEPSGGRTDAFHLRLDGAPEYYRPGHAYTVSLLAMPPAYFRGFNLIAVKEGTTGEHEEDHVGEFKLIDRQDSQFVHSCPVAVSGTTPRRRTRVHITWTAPSAGTGCLNIKANIAQKKMMWFSDSGSLTKTLCEKGNEDDDTKQPIPGCCACDSAKYRLTFYGNWSESTHPRDYPKLATHWSALIGASHSANYVPWEYGGLASDGVRRVAEWGSPIAMEEEIRRQGPEILTVIKMKSLWPAWQPRHIRPGPSAEFSVDRDHPFMSFLSMLGPSPDWNVGLSAENLCTSDCSWVQHSVQDLIPWDAGTDSGTTYESPNLPTIPQERIRPLTSLDHLDSPFYDTEGGPITPVARVIIERLARKGEHCNTRPDDVDDVVSGEDEDEEDQTFRTCVYEPWSQWSACSSRTCDPGKQMRQRRLRAQLDFSHPCLHTQDMQTCQGHCPAQDNSVCTLSEWLPWSACSEMCGQGVRRRERYVKHYPDDGSMCKLETEETESCTVNTDCSKFPCMLSIWTEWTSCSVTCAIGMRTRRRTFKQPAEADVCTEPLTEAEKCMLPECPIDCQVSEWLKEGRCSRSCGRGRELWVRHVLRAPHFGGTSCPTLRESRPCRISRCPRREKHGRRRERAERACFLSRWSSWRPCSAACGGGQQQRVRRPRPRHVPNCSGTSETRTCNDHPCD